MALDESSLKRSAASALITVAATAGLATAVGAEVSWGECLMAGAAMGASSVASDIIHEQMGVEGSGVSSAAGCGAVYAAFQYLVNGDNNLAVNFGGAFLLDVLVENGARMYYVSQMVAEDAAPTPVA